MDDDEWDDGPEAEVTAIDAFGGGKTDGIDDALVRWTAMLLVQGFKESEVIRRLSDADLNTTLTRDESKRLMSLSRDKAEELRYLTVARAEMGDTDWLRLDSYSRRKRMLALTEGIVHQAHALADNVSALNNVSFMAAGLVKQQDALDKMSGAQDAKPAVVVNINYDPIDQFRQVVQEELRIIEIEAEAIDTDSED
jgi:hypothetical protein|tara:strand:+ start:725 stop:1312 length:588 start_codon:yes stop_codon:yes gene_type:complete